MKKKERAKCIGCDNEEEAEEALEAEEKIEKLEEEIDTGQHPETREKYKPVNEQEWKNWDAQ